jgi:phosphoglycerol geranylgeranyltransferase
MRSVYKNIISGASKGEKQFAVLIDPDNVKLRDVEKIALLGGQAKADYWFTGGSLLTNDMLEQCIHVLKANSDIPVVLFPGNYLQINRNADAILFLSLISGRNPEMLIGKHVIAAPYLKKSGLEIIPTGYMLVESGKPSGALYMSNSIPIPAEKEDIAVCTAMAGEMLGLKLIYLEAGSGANHTVPPEMIRRVKENIKIPLIAGGGIKTPEKAKIICNSGADIVVVGNAIEKSKNLICEMAAAIHSK